MLWEEILSLIFPLRCVGCGKQGSAICAICERTIITRPQALSKTTAVLFDYQHPLVKKAIWALKYHRESALGRYFGTALYREFFKQLTRGNKYAAESFILIPIPAGRKAVAMRGYNHAEVIANTIAACGKADGMKIRVEGTTLYKKRQNDQQVRSRAKEQREQNVRDIFDIHEGEKLRGQTVILIDDVITTGATIGEARRAVKAWGPKRVLTIAVAH